LTYIVSISFPVRHRYDFRKTEDGKTSRQLAHLDKFVEIFWSIAFGNPWFTVIFK